MSRKKWEVLPAGEMRRKYGLYAENRPIVKLDPLQVPEVLRGLVPLAEKFGISDDLIREDFLAKTPTDELVKLRQVVQQHIELLEDWLAGPASQAPELSKEYLAFTCMLMASDGC